MASGAYPTLFDPVYIDGELYIDGGVRNNYPVQEVLDLGADYIIGIDLQDGLASQEELRSATKVIEQLITYNIVEKRSEERRVGKESRDRRRGTTRKEETEGVRVMQVT